MKFKKYQALGNDYLVYEADEPEGCLTPERIRLLCDRHYGIGADGILVWEEVPDGFGIRIFNPDGSEAEKSGNGLRIFGRYLYDKNLVSDKPFSVLTKGGEVKITVKEAGNSIDVYMGRASFRSADIPVTGPDREIQDEIIEVAGKIFHYNVVSLGNPHCVIFVDVLRNEDVLRYGPLIEKHIDFPNRVNVQFVKILAPDKVQIEIWERGVGYTLASGSSACAASLVAHRAGMCLPDTKVFMPGGSVTVSIDPSGGVVLTGPAKPVMQAVWLG